MFTYLLIDEFQDTNPVQRKLVRRWSTGGKNIFVIGDPDQSIYGFRGARSSCFSELQQDFPALRIITLRKNYRSTPEIIAGALPVIAHNSGKKRELAATQPAGAAVRVLTAGSTLSEGIWIAKEIAGMTGGLGMLDAQNCAPDRRNVRPFSDIAVLCRTHRQLGSIEYCLQHDSIPYVVSGRGSELDDPAVQGALAFFRFLRNPADTVALTAALCLVRNLSVKQAHKIMAADEYGNGPDPAWSSSITHEKRYMLLKKNGCPQEFLADIDTYLPQLDTKQPQILLEQWTAEHGKNSATEQLLNLASFHLTMAELLDILTLGKEADLHRASGKNYAAGAVQLMTLHGSKGLEFPVVFLAGIDKDKLPLERKGAAVDIEEERRLFYVGMTRAKEELVLSAAAPVSAFLSELPDSVQHCAPALHHRGQETQQLELF
jgi:superfamily I DNA/RNA helicase